LTVRAFSAQSADLVKIQNSSGTDVVVTTPTGTFRTAGLITAGNVTDVLGQLSVYVTAASRIGAVIRGAASQTANLQEWQNSAGTVQARVTSGGSIVTTQGFAVLGGASISGSIAALFQSATASRIPVVVQGAASQTANLQEWQNSGGTVLSRVDNLGSVSAPFFGSITASRSYLQTNGDTGSLQIFAGSASLKALTVRGAASQSVNLFEVQNSAGAVLARINQNGQILSSVAILGATVETSNGHTSIREGFSGGMLQVTKATAAQNNPGANIGRIYFRDGTDAGTLKLVVRAGASGAETTILDNIPQ
jgi:hypothetical protein